MRRQAVVLVVACLLAPTGPATAEVVCDDAHNLIPNCGFDANIAEWSLRVGSFAWSSDGHDAAGSMEGASGGTMAEETSTITCVEVDGLTAYGFGAHLKVVSGAPSECTMIIEENTSAGCEGYLTEIHASWPSLGPEWSAVSSFVQTMPPTRSIAVRLFCAYWGGVPFTVRFDDVYIGEGMGVPPIFSDGFESGSICAWSNADCCGDGFCDAVEKCPQGVCDYADFCAADCGCASGSYCGADDVETPGGCYCDELSFTAGDSCPDICDTCSSEFPAQCGP